MLVVEDHDETRELLRELLVASGYDVVGGATAEDGLHELRSGRYDVVVSDHWLDRGRTGGWMLGAAAAEGLLSRTPAIMCTAERRVSDLPDGVPIMSKPVARAVAGS